MAEKGIVAYKTEGGNEIKLSGNIIRRYICEDATEQECVLFMGLCKAHKLDPFIREAHLIKYGNQPATMVVGKDVFTKRAFRNPKFEGMKAGIFIKTASGKYKEREGSMVLPNETVLGAWCKVYVKGYREPIYDSVSFDEYAGRRKDGSLNQTWRGKPGTMIRKVAIVHALREAFPEEFGGLYDAAEMGVEQPNEQPVEVTPDIQSEPQPQPAEVAPEEPTQEDWVPSEADYMDGEYYEEQEF